MNASFRRAWIGFLVAPAFPALIVYLATAFGSQREAIWGFKLFAVAGYVATLVVGLPCYLLLEHRKSYRLFTYLIVGAVVGPIAIALSFIPYIITGDWDGNHDQAYAALRTLAAIIAISMLSGSSASVVFWLIAVRRDK